jgi:hypothetical protein
MPLCGAAVTFFAAAAKKVTKENGLTPPMLVFSTGSQRSHASHCNVLAWVRYQRIRNCLTHFIHPHSGHPYLMFHRPFAANSV